MIGAKQRCPGLVDHRDGTGCRLVPDMGRPLHNIMRGRLQAAVQLMPQRSKPDLARKNIEPGRQSNREPRASQKNSPHPATAPGAHVLRVFTSHRAGVRVESGLLHPTECHRKLKIRRPFGCRRRHINNNFRRTEIPRRGRRVGIHRIDGINLTSKRPQAPVYFPGTICFLDGKQRHVDRIEIRVQIVRRRRRCLLRLHQRTLLR